jgi:hypothetical protein
MKIHSRDMRNTTNAATVELMQFAQKGGTANKRTSEKSPSQPSPDSPPNFRKLTASALL